MVYLRCSASAPISVVRSLDTSAANAFYELFNRRRGDNLLQEKKRNGKGHAHFRSIITIEQPGKTCHTERLLDHEIEARFHEMMKYLDAAPKDRH